MHREEIGKIRSVSLGMGGYQEAMFGVSFDLGGKSWGVSDFWGTWARNPDNHCKWTVNDQDKIFMETSRRILRLLQVSGRRSLDELVGVPVKIKFENNTLKEWEVIEDAC